MRLGFLTLCGVLAAPAAAGAAATAPRVEVAFVVDATGSMGPYIVTARSKIKDIADDMATGDPRPEVRFALVRFRDRSDAWVTQLEPFSKDIAVMKKALDDTSAQGGGDTPEAVLEGLEKAIDGLDWSVADANVVKLIYLVGDAPAHTYPDGPSEKLIADKALAKGIVIHTIACGRMDGTGQAQFEKLARVTEGRPFSLGASSAGATKTASLGAAVSGSAKAYSSAAGVKYGKDELPKATVVPLAVPPPAGTSGLIGAELRWIADQAAWTDVWAAHQSLVPAASRQPPPAIDFARYQVLVLGGADAGLSLRSLEIGDGVRWADVAADGHPGVHFVLIPAATTAVLTKGHSL